MSTRQNMQRILFEIQRMDKGEGDIENRDQLISQLPRYTLKLYDMIIGRYSDNGRTAVVGLKQGKFCMGCCACLPVTFISKIRRGEIVQWEHCGRMVIIEDGEERGEHVQ